MQAVEQSTVINASLAQVQRWVYDLESIPRWATVSGRVFNLRGEGVGRTCDWEFSAGGLTFRGTLEVLEQTDTTFITKTRGDADSLWTITLTPLAPEKTAIRVVVEYSIPNALIEPLVDVVVQRLTRPAVAQENMERFKTLVEKHARETASAKQS